MLSWSQDLQDQKQPEALLHQPQLRRRHTHGQQQDSLWKSTAAAAENSHQFHFNAQQTDSVAFTLQQPQTSCTSEAIILYFRMKMFIILDFIITTDSDNNQNTQTPHKYITGTQLFISSVKLSHRRYLPYFSIISHSICHWIMPLNATSLLKQTYMLLFWPPLPVK